MAQENFNVSFPNDGLGDALRAAFVKQQAMNTELYGDKVDKVTGKDLSTNDFTNALKAKLDGIQNFAEVNVQPNWLQTDVTADDYIKNKPTFNNINDGLVQAGTATIDEVDDTIEFSVGWIVLLGGELAANFTPVTIPVPLATDKRFDIFVMDVTGSIIRVAGVDSETPLIPSVPSGIILLTTVLVTDAEIGTPVIPNLVGFVQKVYFDYSKISLDVETLPADGRTNFTIETPIATFEGFDGSSELYLGKRFIIRNLSGADCELLAGQAVDLPFADTIVLADGENIEFDVFNNELKRVGIEGGGGGVTVHNLLTGRDATDAHPISSVTNLQTALNGKQAIAEIQTEDFTADFDKVYNCRGTLTVTNPTGVLNKSYEIRVLGGAVTVGGEVYTVGSVIQVSFNGTTFVYNLLFVLGADTEIIINKFSTLTLADYIALTTDAKTLYFTEEQNVTGWQNLRSESNFTILTTETQLTFADGVYNGDSSFSLIDLTDAKLKAINEKDYMFYRFQAGIVTPSGSNHWFKILLKVDGVTIAVSPVFNLVESVGVVEQISYHFVVPASASLVANGAYFYLKGSTNITAETPLVGSVRVHKSTNATE
jgi:hypothetical protein